MTAITEKIHIAILDDHPILSAGIQSLLEQEPRFRVTAVVESLPDLERVLSTKPINVLIADVVVPGLEGLTLFKTMQSHHPKVKVIAYTQLNNITLAKQLIYLGVRGFVNKQKRPEKLMTAILKVVSGEPSFPDRFSHLLKQRKAQHPPIQLTPQELKILILVSQGRLSKEIASELQISPNTVRVHRSHLFEKLSVQNMGELIHEALRLGLISAED